jgi:hypothetical protein
VPAQAICRRLACAMAPGLREAPKAQGAAVKAYNL